MGCNVEGPEDICTGGVTLLSSVVVVEAVVVVEYAESCPVLLCLILDDSPGLSKCESCARSSSVSPMGWNECSGANNAPPSRSLIISLTLLADEERACRARRTADNEVVEEEICPVREAPGRKPKEVFVGGAEGGARCGCWGRRDSDGEEVLPDGTERAGGWGGGNNGTWGN